MGIGSLLNLGPRSEQWLTAVGITTYEDLERLGSVQAYQRVREAFPRASANLLYALEGALLDVRWDLLPVQLREDLRRAADS